MPLMKYLEKKQPRKNRRGRKKEITLSKTRELGSTVESEYLSELTEEEFSGSGRDSEGAGLAVNISNGLGNTSSRVKGFMYYDVKFIRPFLTRR